MSEKAAVLVYTLAKSQACRDGNKRVALIVLRAFLYVNGCHVTATSDELASAIITAAESERGDRDQEIIRLTAWLERVMAHDEEDL